MSYVVQTGETISAVSKKLKTSFQALRRQNPDGFAQTKDGRWYLKAGFKLQTEQSPQTSSASISDSISKTQPITTTSTSTAPDKTYTVQPGDTLKAVARKMGFSFQEIKAANPQAVGSMGDGRQFFYAGATLKMSGGFQDSLNAAQRTESAPAVTTMKSSSTQTTVPTGTDPRPYNSSVSNTSAQMAPRTESYRYPVHQTNHSVEALQNLPYRSPGFVKAANDHYQQNPVIGTTDFDQAGDQSLTQSQYVLEAPLDRDLNLAFGFTKERHETSDVTHRQQGSDNRGVTMGLRFRF